MNALLNIILPALPLLLLAGVFAAAETALLSLGPARLARLEEERAPEAPALAKLMQAPRRLIVTLLLGYELPNLAVVGLVTYQVHAGWPSLQNLPPFDLAPGPLSAALVISLVLILLAAETLPRAIGGAFSEGISRFLARPLLVFTRVYAPLVWALRSLSQGIFRTLGLLPSAPLAEARAEEEIRELVLESSREGLLDVTERELLVNLLRSGETTAGDIMTPRQEIVALPCGVSLAEARATYEREGYSRMPVYEGDLDHVVGALMAKDLLLHRSDESDRPLASILRKPLFVPEARRIPDLLRDFRHARTHLAIVADEFGATAGLVTMEDVLEEIFGEVREEEGEEELENLGDNHWRALGRMAVIDFNARTGASLPAGPAKTLSGLTLWRLGRRPRPGDEVKAGSFRFKVLEARGINIRRVEVRREDKP